MRRITIITTLLAAMLAAAPASGALRASCSTCSALWANGDGQLSVAGSGAEWGTAGPSTIWVRDRTGKGDPRKWISGSHIHWTSIGDDGYKATTTHSITVNASGQFWVKLSGRDIAVSGAVQGTGSISGSGTYTLNRSKHAWPRRPQALHF